MFDFLVQLPDYYIFAILLAISIPFSILAIVLVKRYIPHGVRYNDNAVLTCTCSLVSLIYGILAGLIALYLINNNNYTADAVLREANSIANIYRDSKWLKEPAQTQIKLSIKNYIQEVINDEWPLMSGGKTIDTQGDLLINKLSDVLQAYVVTDNVQSLVVGNILTEIKSLYNARQQRINMSYNQLSQQIWMVIVLSSILILLSTYLFGVNFYLHLFASASAALMVSSLIFLLITLDRPFQGDFSINPDGLRSVLNFIESGH